MLDNLLIGTLKKCLDRDLHLYGVNNFEVSRSAQPTDQYTSGDQDSPVKTQIFLHQVEQALIQNSPCYSENRSERVTEFNYDGTVKETIVTSIRQTTKEVKIRIDVIKWLDIKDPASLTSDDVAEIISDYLFDIETITCLRKEGIRMMSRSSIRPDYIVNEKERYENFASFDVVVTYTTTRKRVVKQVDHVNHKQSKLDRI